MNPNLTVAAQEATAPNKTFTREQNLAIIARTAATVSDAVAAVMEWRVELGNLFPTETYGSGCGGTCGRYGCTGSCIHDAWRRYFSTTYDWPRRDPPLPASGDFAGDMQPGFSGDGDAQNAGGVMGPGHAIFGGGSGAVALPLPQGAPPGARFDPVLPGGEAEPWQDGSTRGGRLGPTPDHLRVPGSHDVPLG
jgi:hypothetical protein